MNQFFWERRYLYLVVSNFFWALYLCYPKNFFLVSLSPFIVAEIMNYIGVLRQAPKKRLPEMPELNTLLPEERQSIYFKELLAAISKIDEFSMPAAIETKSDKLRELLIKNYSLLELKNLPAEEIQYSEYLKLADPLSIDKKKLQLRTARHRRLKSVLFFWVLAIGSLLLTWIVMIQILIMNIN